MSSSVLLNSVCADCGSLDPPWALVNRGLLICDECCSIHRSLGRHISQVRSLKKVHWNITQLQMIQTLNSSGVNSIWEHNLPEMKTKKKPTPKDPVHPTKAEFIRAKHKELQFIFRSGESEEELNLELHSIVKTPKILMTLKLLAQGADPNFLHPEKGTRPIHVAAKAGQLNQVELLVVYGADPSARDANGNSPPHVARLVGHREIHSRLTEMLYTVTDRLIYFLTRMRPDHATGQHFIIPTERDCVITPEPNSHGRPRIAQLSHAQFEDLATDVYDEVDRRETETIWLSSGASLEYSTVPFLPVDPDLSTMRNQGRQKLARLSPGEFSALVLDILHDADRRQLVIINGKVNSDEEPLYDSVASDDDYATAEQLAIMVAQNSRGLPLTLVEPAKSSAAKAESSVERELRERLALAQARESQLAQQVHHLTKAMSDVSEENCRLKTALSGPNEPEPVMDLIRVGNRPVSMYEARETVRGVMPLSEEVIRRTTQVTKRIQELWSSVRPTESNFVYVPCAERIRVAVAELTAIFPQASTDDVVRNALYQLNTSTMRLQVECAELEKCAESVRQLAFKIAEANRLLVKRFK
ncbi:ARF GTPase-activating protein GIT2 [Halyomorpha halys]|uniref:ARF GTPase-activating protein GIT2 n=1 Tax=Halyomorpha halys TaxID=286706 RepID=UPI0006D4D83D|nr:ARF GTPase-activating protein GIT2 [Halyomorpha halys]